MGRKTTARRFEPRYGVSQAGLEVEAGYLGYEFDDWAILAPADVAAKRSECHANCEHDWQHLRMILEGSPERDRRVLQAMLFRDIYLLLELYLTYLRIKHPEMLNASSSPPKTPASPLEFSEFLFCL